MWLNTVLFPLVSTNQLCADTSINILIQNTTGRFIHVRNELSWLQQVKFRTCTNPPLFKILQFVFGINDYLFSVEIEFLESNFRLKEVGISYASYNTYRTITGNWITRSILRQCSTQRI